MPQQIEPFFFLIYKHFRSRFDFFKPIFSYINILNKFNVWPMNSKLCLNKYAYVLDSSHILVGTRYYPKKLSFLSLFILESARLSQK